MQGEHRGCGGGWVAAGWQFGSGWVAVGWRLKNTPGVPDTPVVGDLPASTWRLAEPSWRHAAGHSALLCALSLPGSAPFCFPALRPSASRLCARPLLCCCHHWRRPAC
eukprot:360741-Chlamydomonas_euryale.AAC.1